MQKSKFTKLLCLVLSLLMILCAAPLTALAVGPNETDIIIVDDEFDLEIAKLSATIELNALAGDDASDAVKAIIDNAIEDIEAAMSVSEVEMIVAAAKSDVAELLELNVNTGLMKEVLTYDTNNAAAGGSFGTYYYYEGTYFTVTADISGAATGVVAGNQWYTLTVAAKDNTVTIDSIEAVIGDYGEAYAYVGISGGEKTETDESGVENGSVVHIKNINASSFCFGDGTDTCAFKDITVYFTVSEPECEHSLIEDYKNNGKTHLQKCELCGEYVAPAAHTFDKHVCVCGAKETVEMTETLAYNANNITDGVYSYTGTDFTLTDTQPGDTYGMTVGYGHDFAVEAIDSSLIIESITAVVNAGGSDYATIGVSSGEKEEKGGVDNGTTVHVNNINASSFSFTGLVSGRVCKMTDVTVYYTDGTIAHDFTGDYYDNGDTHSIKCTKCEEYGCTENHTYTDGVCVCGAEDPSEFVITSEGVLIKYNGEGGNVEIPNTVVEIAADVFNGCTALTSVELPDTVSAIGNNAFKDCTGLTEVILPEGDLQMIGNYAFAGCTKLAEISIPYGVIGIGSYAFDGCEKLKDLIITDSVIKILTGAFDGDYLENVYFLCIDDGEAIETRMSKFGDFNYVQFPHEIEDGECILCGMTEEEIVLDEAKQAAIAELEAMVSDDSSDEVLVIIDDAYWAIIDEAETVADVEEILNAAKADVAAQIAAEVLAEAQADALDVIKTLADADDSDAVKAIITKAISDIRTAESTEAVEAIVAAAEKAVADQVAAEEAAAALAEAKAEAAAAVELLGTGDDSDEVAAIIEKALADIEDATSADAVEAIVAAAEKDVADQRAAEEAAAALAAAKTEAKATVNALAEGASDAVKAIVEKAVEDIEAAANESAINSIVSDAKNKVNAQKNLENVIASKKAEVSTALANARTDEAKEILTKALADLDNCTDLSNAYSIPAIAIGSANGKDSMFNGYLNSFKNIFINSLSDNAIAAEEGYLDYIIPALESCTNIDDLLALYDAEEKMIDFYDGRDGADTRYDKILKADDISDETKALAAEAAEKIRAASTLEELNDLCKEYDAKVSLSAKKDGAVYTISNLATADDSDEVTAIIEKAIADIKAASSEDAVKAVRNAAVEAVEAQRETEAEALAEAKAEAAAAVELLGTGDDSDEVAAIIEKALADIEDATSVDAVEAIAAAAEKDVADQRAAEEAAAALAEAKEEAKAAVEALADDTASDEVKAIIEKALADIEDAEDIAAVEAIADAAEKDIADQKAAEEAAEAAKALAEAKEEAKAAIDAAAADDDDVKAAAEEAKAAIDAATTLEEVEAAKAAGLEKIADASGACPYCGEKEHKNCIDKFFCLIRRFVELVFMALGFGEEIKALF